MSDPVLDDSGESHDFSDMDDDIRTGAADPVVDSPPSDISLDTSSSQYNYSERKFDQRWYDKIQAEYTARVREGGKDECLWSKVLQFWQEKIRDAPFEKVEREVACQVLRAARLARLTQPMDYETLRRLGPQLLETDENNFDGILTRLKPQQLDSEWYKSYYGSPARWDRDFLSSHLEKLTGISIAVEKHAKDEEKFGFSIAHVRSNRYQSVELAAILRSLVETSSVPIAEESSIEEWIKCAERLEGDDNRDSADYIEVQTFIIRCMDQFKRAEQSLIGAIMRAADVGVIPFCKLNNVNLYDFEITKLDEFYHEQQPGYETATLEQIANCVNEEKRVWKKWREENNCKEPPLFSSLKDISTPALMTNLMSNIKLYMERKLNLQENVQRAGRLSCVTAAILDSKKHMQDTRTGSGEGRNIAVFGYKMAHTDRKGILESEEKSVILRKISLYRRQEFNETRQEIDFSLYEIGLSLSGNYLNFVPNDEEDLNDVLKTSGLGLDKSDSISYYQFVNHNKHSSDSKTVHEILSQSNQLNQNFTHILLVLNDRRMGNETPFQDISDAGCRFLIDLRDVGNVRTEGVGYRALAVQPIASVCQVCDSSEVHPFYRLAVLMPPSAVYQTGKSTLTAKARRGQGFMESAEVIAEVLGLDAIDRQNMNKDEYSNRILKEIENNALILYYASIQLLHAVHPDLANLVTMFWEKKLKGGFGSSRWEGSTEEESRLIVLNLITAGSSNNFDRGNLGITNEASEADRSMHLVGMRSNLNKRIAIVSKDHWKALPTIISKETHFAQEEIFVEESNFESLFLRLKQANPTSIVFLHVNITGKITADQINQLIELPAPAFKMIFQHSSSILKLLDFSSSFKDLIYRPESIRDSIDQKFLPIPYSRRSAVGSVIHETFDRLCDNPHELSHSYWCKEVPLQYVVECGRWLEKVKEWLRLPVTQTVQMDSFIRILVCSDHGKTAEQLHKESCEDVRIRLIDAGNRADFDSLKEFLSENSEFQFQERSGARNEDNHPKASNVSIRCPAIVLQKASFLPQRKLEVLISRCFKFKVKIVVLVSCPLISLCRFRIYHDSRSPPSWVHAPILTQRNNIYPGINVASESNYHLICKGLKLMFSLDTLITDEFVGSVQDFIKGNMQNLSQLSFLDHNDDLFRAENQHVLEDIFNNLSKSDQPVEVTWDALQEECKTLAGLLARHINRHIRFPAETWADDMPLICFADFCRQPRVRFLSQVHRVEAYIHFLSKNTASTSALIDSEKNLPFGLPLIQIADISNANVHCAHNPGKLLCVDLSHGETFLQLNRSEYPMYMDPGHGDAVIRHLEIIEHQSILGAELNWEEMFVNGPEIDSDEVFKHICTHSSCRIMLLLSMNPSQIVNLKLSNEGMREIEKDFLECQDLLHELPRLQFGVLRSRTAAIWWLLLVSGSSAVLTNKYFEEDQILLLENGIFFETKKSDDGVQMEEKLKLYLSVAKAMISLDMVKTLSEQHAIRDFIMSEENKSRIEELFKDKDLVIGRALMSVCLSKENLSKILQETYGSVMKRYLGCWLRWVRDADSVELADLVANTESIAFRVKPKALLYLIQSANPPYRLKAFRDGILLPSLQTIRDVNGEDEAVEFYGQFMSGLCTHETRALAVELIEVLSEGDCDPPLAFPSDKIPTPWSLIYQSFANNEFADDLLQLALRETFDLPFESSKKLCSLYILYFKNKSFEEADLSKHIALLPNELSRSMVFNVMNSSNDDSSDFHGDNNDSFLALLWFCWWSCPARPLQLRYSPRAGSWMHFKRVARAADQLAQLSSSQGLSNLARFTLTPHTLPASMFNAIKRHVVGDDKLIENGNYVVAQEKHSTWPVYCFRCHARPLPRSCIEYLVKSVEGTSFPGLQGHKSMFPITDQGVDQERVVHNLNILLHIKSSMTNEAQIFLTALAWFYAAGISLEDLGKMCGSGLRKTLNDNLRQMQNSWSQKSFTTALVFCPLPVYMDVRFRSGKDNIRLFQGNHDSETLTIQWLLTLLLQFGINESGPIKQYQEHTNKIRSGQAYDPQLPHSFMADIMEEIAKELQRKYSDVDFLADHKNKRADISLSSAEAAIQTQVVEDMVAITDFFSQLRSSSGESMIESCIQGLCTGLQSCSKDKQVAVADTLFTLIGITPVNEGFEVKVMLREWRSKGLVFSSSVLNEIHFMANTVYKTQDYEHLSQDLLDLSKDQKHEHYPRYPAQTSLSSKIDDLIAYESTRNIYEDVVFKQDFEFQTFSSPPGQSTEQRQAQAARDEGQQSETRRCANFDHAHNVSSNYTHIRPRRNLELFKNAVSSDRIQAQASSATHVSGKLRRDLKQSERTVSARKLVSLNIRSGYGVVHVVPGLNPVLRSPGDSRKIPHSQQTNLRRGLKSFDEKELGQAAEIEAIFSNNGGAWEYLNQLPRLSTITAKGLYLRKNLEGDWMILLGAASNRTALSPPVFLFTLLDVYKLAAFDFDAKVLETLKSLVQLSYFAAGKKFWVEEANELMEIDQVLNKLRCLRKGNDGLFEKYIRTEQVMCSAVWKTLHDIKNDDDGCNTVLFHLNLEKLEDELQLQLKCLSRLGEQLSDNLSLLVGIRDPVPRSQLLSTLEKTLHNQNKFLARLQEENGEKNSTESEEQGSKKSRKKAKEQTGKAIQNDLITAHEHITQKSFMEQSVKYLEDIEKRKIINTQIVWRQHFENSDSEDEEKLQPKEYTRKTDKTTQDLMDSSSKRMKLNSRQEEEQIRYHDDSGNESPTVQTSLFPAEWGYGHRDFSKYEVISLPGDMVPLYQVQIDVKRLKIKYNERDGLPILYVFHKSLLHASLDHYLKVAVTLQTPSTGAQAKPSPMGDLLSHRTLLLNWLCNLVRSPLPEDDKSWFLNQLEYGPTTARVPSMCMEEGDTCSISGDLNLLVIAHCVGVSLPAPNQCLTLFHNSFHIPPSFLPFCKRKDDKYGVHIVKRGTRKELEKHGAVMEVCDLGYDALTRSKDNASMYLTIIGHFSAYTWLVYVTGLDNIDDALLKWLAEYTRIHPWRFVYLENTQTSWNFSENRDRCVYEFAPVPIERSIRIDADLKSEEVARLRPTHIQPYPRMKHFLVTEQGEAFYSSWEKTELFVSQFFGCDGLMENEGNFTDYRSSLNEIMQVPKPCVILLCSPPGAGKSHFSDQIAENLRKQHQISKAFIDGSDDRLVDLALTEILEREIADTSAHLFLIVDEFHMLKDVHKTQLFQWLRGNVRRLHVLLIANRTDSRDSEHLKSLQEQGAKIGIEPERVKAIIARLGHALLKEVMANKKTIRRSEIRTWMHCARCIFGGEAVSLRGIDELDAILAQTSSTLAADKLTEFLLNKVPTISTLTARQFAEAFLAFNRESPGQKKEERRLRNSPSLKGMVVVMFQAALLTDSSDNLGVDFPDYVAFKLGRAPGAHGRAYDAPPALRVAAWCCHMRKQARSRPASDLTGAMDDPSPIFENKLVDQCGFPLQLEVESDKELAEGTAFSWGSDYSKLEDIIDAVKHGHSVDWSDVQNKCWNSEPVQDSSLLVELLSVCTSPAKVLSALKKDNLCSLLKKSGPSDSLALAKEILKNQIGMESAEDDKYLSPYRTALWMAILYDASLDHPLALLRAMGQSEEDRSGALTETEDVLVDSLIWASTHMQDMISCKMSDNAQSKTKFVVQTLVFLSRKLILAEEAIERIARLWGGMFAHLLSCAEREEPELSFNDVLLHVALYSEDCYNLWEDPLPALWAVAKGKAKPSQITDLWSKHRGLLFGNWDAESRVWRILPDSSDAILHPRLAGGILCTDGEIDLQLQLAILTRGGDVDMEFTGVTDRNYKNAVRLLAAALESLSKDETSEVKVKEGKFRSKVLEALENLKN